MYPAVTFPPTRLGHRAALLGVLALAVAGCGGQAAAAVPPTSPPAAPFATTDARAAVEPIPAPVVLPGRTVETGGPATVSAGSAPSVGTATTGTAVTGVGYVYPFYAGTPPAAPDNTILVTGTGRATMKADESDRAAAQQQAIAAAIADARAQADTVAKATGVNITGVLSVSVSVAQGYGIPQPVMVPDPKSGALASLDPSISEPTATMPASSELDVSVTVAYKIG